MLVFLSRVQGLLLKCTSNWGTWNFCGPCGPFWSTFSDFYDLTAHFWFFQQALDAPSNGCHDQLLGGGVWNLKFLVFFSILPETNLVGQLYISGKQFHSIFWSTNSVCNILIILHKKDFTIIHHASCLWCVSNEISLVWGLSKKLFKYYAGVYNLQPEDFNFYAMN